MKMSRDYGPVVSSRAETPGQSQMATASTQRLTTTDALTYLRAVKDVFQDRRDKYEDFLDIMKDFKGQRVGTCGVISRVKELFKAHQHLILGFNAFLPKGYEITLRVEDEPLPKKKPVEFEEAISFVNKIKARFNGHDHVYKAFLDILNMYRKDNKSITEVYQEVSILFHDHADLLVEFTHFLPDTSGTASVHYGHTGSDYIPQRDDRGDSPNSMARTNQVEMNPALPHAVDDPFIDRADSHQWNQFENEKEKQDDTEKNEWGHDANFGHKRKHCRKDDSVTDQSYQGIQDPVSSICDKVKEKLQDSKSYEKFSDCVRSYKRKYITASQFHMLVESLLGTYSDLMEECGDFITYAEKTGCLWDNKIVRPLKVEDPVGDDHEGEDRDKIKDRNYRDNERYDKSLTFSTKYISGQREPLYENKEKFIAKPIHELDLSNCESCTPSYRLLPTSYPISSASRRTDIGANVLNDRWVSVTSGSEDYSFKHMRKNQYEESLFKCEDDRFELDMLLESVNATTKHVEELLDSIDTNPNMAGSSFCIEDHLSALNLRCVERLYGDHGLDVMDVLRKNAPLSLPVILTRLKQKQEEWFRCRSDFNKVWAEIYSKNYHKSLDHRSFYFKQQDTKNLSAKALIAEIKEMSERNQSEGEMLLSIGAGYRQPIKPQMEFGYSDPEIHEDLYQLMKYSCREVFTPDQHNKIMKIWTTFLEPMLGIASHLRCANDTDNVKENNNSVKNVNSGTERNKSPVDGVSSGNCKSVGVLKNGCINILAEPSSSGMLMGGINSTVKTDGFHGADNGSYKSDSSCHRPQHSVIPTDVSALGDKDILQTNGSDGANVDCMAGADEQSQARGYKLSASSTVGEMNETIKTLNGREEIEGSNKCVMEEGELSPTEGIKVNNFATFGNASIDSAQTSCLRVGNIKIFEEEIGNKVTKAIGANADNEDDASTQGSSSGNAFENVAVSASESADGEECFADEPDEDRENDEDNNKAESQGEVGAFDTEGFASVSDRFLLTAKPLTMNIPSTLVGKKRNSQIFYGNDSFYLLFRLHQMMYERMQSAKLHSSSPQNKWRILNDVNPTDSYARFKDALHSLLNGSSDNAKFEDDCRAIVGAQSYILFTLDKLIHKLVKQLQTVATEETENKLLHLYAYERSRNHKKFSDVIYSENACFLLPEDNLYRIEYSPESRRLTLQLRKNENDKLEVTAVSMDPNFVVYLNDVLLSVPPERKNNPGVFLTRNKRKNGTGDETSDDQKFMEEIIIYNGLESKVVCSTLKTAYVLDTEDFLYRIRKRRKTSHFNGSCNDASNGHSQRVKRFCKLMCS